MSLLGRVAPYLLAPLLVMAALFGAWVAAGHYRPMLDKANADLNAAASARDNLLELTGEQNEALARLSKAAADREQAAGQAVAKARDQAAPDYAAANRLMQERTGGDQCQAAGTIIDQELGL
ncbi:hypothetical protein HX890_12100 [Pseudomonas gingeri]|nr:hypothetical protein [Pseudomonas gingeri]